jgi:hypothetical protein
MRYLIILVVLASLALPIAAATNNAQLPGLSRPLVPSLTSTGFPNSQIGWTSLTGSKPLLSPSGNQGTFTSGKEVDPFAVIDEKLAPAEAGALKSLIQNTLHAFSYDAATGAWTARNYAGQVLFTYTKDGTAEFSDGENEFGLSLLGVGRNGDLAPAGSGVVQADGRQLNIARTEYTEWYKNNDEGVEQGVTIPSRPSGSGPLQVGFGLTSEDSFSLKDDQTLTIKDVSGTSLFTYTGLSAFSANGRPLPASLATDGTTLYWSVDDADAIYPVTIDPVILSASRATAIFTGSVGEDELFGSSVSLSSDGSRVLVGAVFNNTAGSHAGAAYIFNMPAGGWTGTTPASAATARFIGGAVADLFGCSVSLSSDGSRALIGAWRNETVGVFAGTAYIFNMPAGGWTGTTSASAATARFTGGNASDIFGYSVSLSSDGSRALVGAMHNATAGSNAGAAYIFNMPAGGWTGTTPASAATARFIGVNDMDNFGNSVSLSSDGSRALVGATGAASNAGTGYIFNMPAGGWTGTTPASAANTIFTGGAGGDNFGSSVSLSYDGSRALGGAVDNDTAGPHAGAAYLFQPPYVILTAGGTTTGTAGTVVNGLTLNPTGTLTNVDLYLGTGPTTLFGSPVQIGLNLPASTATIVNGVSLVGKTAGTYYLIITESGTTNIIVATSTAVYTVTTPVVPPTPIPEPTGSGPGHGSTLSGISPQSGVTGTTVQTTITGTNFPVTTVTGKGASSQVKVWLSSQVNEDKIMGQKVTVKSPTTLTCSFDLTGAAPGTWSLDLSRGSGWITVVLPNAFTVKPATAVPVIHHITPSSVKAGGKAFVITVKGEHFAKGNRVQWKGVARETTFVSATTLKAKVLATDIAKAGRYVVSVYRPGSDAATSNGVSVNVRK